MKRMKGLLPVVAALVAAVMLASVSFGLVGAQTLHSQKIHATTHKSGHSVAVAVKAAKLVAAKAAVAPASQSADEATDQTTPDESATASENELPGQEQADETPVGNPAVTEDQAKAAALAQFPGATVGSVQLDDENGQLVYSVELTDASGVSQDVKVDAMTGTVLPAASSEQDVQYESQN